MKHVLTLFFFILSLSVIAQVSSKTKTMSMGTQNALIVTIPGASENLIEDLWKDYIKDNTKEKAKRNRKTKEYEVLDVKIASISGAGKMNIFTMAEDGQLVTFFDMGDGFLSKESHSKAYDAAVIFLTEFKHEVTREMIREELKEEEKNLSKIEKDLDKLERDLDRYHKTIEKAKEDIAEAEANIEQNGVDQENTKKEIKAQEKVVEEVKEKLENVGK